MTIISGGYILAALALGAIVTAWKKEVADVCVRVAGTALVILGLAIAIKMLLS